MSLDGFADALADRRALRRKLSFWRVAAFAFLIAAVMILGWRGSAAVRQGAAFGAQIARVPISGLITGDAATLDLLKNVQRDPSVKGVILSIDSPGGTTTGAERLYSALRSLAAAKPTVADVGGLAASGAYIAALGADHIVAQGNSLVGSIGVLFEFPNVSKLLNTVGVQMEEIKSSPLKAAPDGLTPTSPQAQAAIESLVADSYAWFKQLVQDRRQMTAEQIAAVSDGRVFTGRQGLALRLVDQLGEENDAVAWLEKNKRVPKNLPIRDWRPKSSSGFHLFSAASALAGSLGQARLAQALSSLESAQESSVLDGLMAVWQADRTH